MDTRLRDLQRKKLISTRTYRCLGNYDLDTLRDVLDYAHPLSELMKLRNFGEKCYREIENLLSEVYPQYDVPPEQVAQQLRLSLEGETGTCLTEAYQSLFDSETRVTRFFQSVYPDVTTLHMALIDQNMELLLFNGEFSLAENQALRLLTVDYLDRALEALAKRGLERKFIYDMYRQKKQWLTDHATFTYAQRLVLLTPVQRACLEWQYKDLVLVLSARSRNYLRGYDITLTDMVGSLDGDTVPYSDRTDWTKRSTLGEIHCMRQKLKKAFENCWGLSEREGQLYLIQEQYPFIE